MKKIYICLILLLFASEAFSQTYPPCTNGSQLVCKCNTAPLLCTIDELDGYVLTMNNYQHPGDAPTPLCPGSNTVPNNPTWFAFKAWCTDLTLNCTLTNCTGKGGSNGVQIAIYNQCGSNDAVACNVNDCGNTNDKTLSMSGLQIGKTYYFMIDGCAGSYCTVTIDIIGTCGSETIEDWKGPIMGETEICAPKTETYTVDKLDGATHYIWYLDGAVVKNSTSNSFTKNWTTAGTYTLCVDAYNDPCIPVTNPPAQNCITIVVNSANAGTITAAPTPLCPDAPVTYNVTGYETNPNNTEVVFVTNAAGEILEIFPGVTGTWTSSECGTFTFYSYNYVTGSNAYVPVVGGNVSSIDCTANCCDLKSKSVTFQDTQKPVLQNKPPNQTLSCYDLLQPMQALNYTDNCIPNGSVPGEETGSADLCSGGTITRTWTIEDNCGNKDSHTQTITINAVPAPTWKSTLPQNQTLTCSQIPTTHPNLDYENTGMGACLVSGTVAPVVTGSADLCGGTITRTWTFTDNCNHTINHEQVLTVTPVPEASFQNPPANMTITCDQIPTSHPSLTYTNGLSGACGISGTSIPTVTGSADLCGGTITRTWTFTDACGRTKTHEQVLTVTPVPQASFQNPPANLNVDCSQIPTTHPDLSYSNGQTGACGISGSVSPVVTGSADLCGGTITRTWTFTDACNRTITHVQTITATPVPAAAFQNAPSSQTVDCAQIPTGASDLSYTNGLSGACGINGSVPAVQSGNADLCGGTITYTWNFTDACNRTITHVQTFTANPVPVATFQNAPSSQTVDCAQIPTGAADLTYTNGLSGACGINGSVPAVQSGNADLCGGTITYTWNFTDACNRSISWVQTYNVNPVPVASFQNAPSSQTVECEQIPTSAPALTYTNGLNGACGINGSVSPVESGFANLCGGTKTYTWNFTDACNRTINWVQNYTVNAVPVATFQNPPGDKTVNCSEIPVSVPDLNYTNNRTGLCAITGTVPAVKSGNSDLCGGTTTYTWTYTDACFRTISHAQNYTATPVPVAVFQNPPGDQVVDCENIPASAPSLSFSNGLSGACGINGSVPATLIGSPSVCGGTFGYNWTYTDACFRTISHTQNVTVNATPVAAFINPPADLAKNCKDIVLNAPPLNYTNNKTGNCAITGSVQAVIVSNYTECGGTVEYLWEYTDACFRTISHTQTTVVEPAPAATFAQPPPDVTVQCTAVPNLDVPLNYSNKDLGVCAISGNVYPTVIGAHDFCGGDYTQVWEFTDNCGRTITAQRKLVVLPAPLPTFTNPPANITIACDQAEQIDQQMLLSYNNNLTGECQNYGDIEAITSGSYDPCGGNLQRTWNLNTCGTLITHTQNIKILPAPDATFFDPPADITLDCGEPFPPADDLYYTNNKIDQCDISGFVSADQYLDNGVMTYTWEFVNPCSNKKITKVQKIYGKLVPDIFLDPAQADICLGSSFNLASIQVTDNNNSNPSISYHSGTPATAANKLSSTVVSPSVTTTYYVLATNTICTDEAPFTITVNTPLKAGGDGQGTVCFGANNVNLFSYLVGMYDAGGVWKNKGSGNINLFDPTKVSFNNAVSGTYGFYYIVPKVGACPADTATVNITVQPDITINIESVSCTPDLDFYNVVITASGYTITASSGTVTNIGSNQYNIGPVSVSNNLTITATEVSTGCTKDFQINAPNCNCPTVLPPVSGGNKKICFGEAIPTLTVTVGTDETADWYDSPTGGTLLAAGTLQYTPSISAPGLYKFYVEAKSTLFPDCKSNVRTLITIEIIANPTGNNASLYACDEDSQGHAQFTLTDAIAQINPNPSLTYAFYATPADANTETNALPINYTNTSTPTQTIYVVLKNQDGCKTLVTLTLNIYPKIVLTLTPKPETCAGSKDATITVSKTGGSGVVEYSIDNITWTGNNVFTGLSQGSYTIYGRDDKACVFSNTVVIPEGLILNIINFNIVCNNAGTDTDASDDYYVVTFNIGNNKANVGTYTLKDGATVLGTFSYGVSKSVNIPAKSQSLTLTFEDVAAGCSVTQNIGPLTPCSTNCEITVTTFTKVCNDAGTNTDPVDDYYTITINATAANGSASNTFKVIVGGNVVATFTYGVGGTITLLADGSNPTITLVDSDDNQCQNIQNPGNLTPCSNTCVINAVIENVNCDNKGTTNDSSDDTYTFDIIVNGVNTSTGWYVSGTPANVYSYTASTMFGPYLISGGSKTFELVDKDDATCKVLINIPAPPPCSDPCIIEYTNLVVGTCNDNNTGNTGTDDTFDVSFMVNSVNGTVTQYNVSWNGNNWGPFDYGQTVTIPGLPANGSTIILKVTDPINQSCVTSMSVSQLPCSSCPEKVDAGPSFTVDCIIKSVILQANATAVATYSWTGPNNFTSTQLNPTVSTPGTYYITADFGKACLYTDSTVVILDSSVPVADAGEDKLLTCLVTEVLLDGSKSSQKPGFVFEWRDENGNLLGNGLTLLVNQPGNYYFTVIDATNNCASPPSLAVVSQNINDPLAPIFADPGEVLNCNVDAIVLSTTPQTNVVFTWTQNNSTQNGSSFTTTKGGLVTLVAVDTVSKCSESNTLLIQELIEYPIVNVAQPAKITCKNPIVIIDASGSQHGPNITYQWLDSNKNPILNQTGDKLSVDKPGKYFISVEDVNIGCVNSDSVVVESDIVLPIVNAGENHNLPCFVFETKLDGTASSASNNFNIYWTTQTGKILNGDKTYTPLVNGEGWYVLHVTDLNTGCVNSDSVFVKINADAPVISGVVVDSVKCYGEKNGSISITQTSGGVPPIEFYINGSKKPNTTGIFSPLYAGAYTIVAKDAIGCESSTTFVVGEGSILNLSLDPSIIVRLGDSTWLEAVVNVPVDELSKVLWTPAKDLSCDSCLITQVKTLSTQQYRITVQDIHGCEATDYIIVLIDKDVNIFIPNIFSPNGDNINDRFTLFADDRVVKIHELKIFDRWGELMYQNYDFAPNDPNLGWDGTFRGKTVNPAVFVYYFVVEYIDGSKQLYKGDITLVRE